MTFNDVSLSDLFRVEAQSQIAKLADGLIALEEHASPEQLEDLMRAAHSLKGAARIVGRDSVVRIAHELEECFVGAQDGRLLLSADSVDVLLRAVDLLTLAAESETPDIGAEERIDAGIAALRAVGRGKENGKPPRASTAPVALLGESVAPLPADAPTGRDTSERLLTLAGEALVTSRELMSHTSDSAFAHHSERALERALEDVRLALRDVAGSGEAQKALAAVRTVVIDSGGQRRARAASRDALGQRVSDIVAHLYERVLDMRMRPFGDGVAGMPRMLRDTGRELGRDARLVVDGETTPVDREILRRLEAPLGHLIRNAVDHGIEPPADRVALGKPQRGTVLVQARHAGGRLLVSVEDDGRGIDLEAVRARVVERGYADAAAASVMTALELSHFLFLPSFTLRDAVTSISGRGVGLDAVQTAVREIGGDVRVVLVPGRGTRFEMQLPLTLSVVRALLVEIAGDPYAFPLARVHRVCRVERSAIATLEGRQSFALDDRQVGMVWAHQLLGMPAPALDASAAVIVVGDADSALGIVVDAFLGEQELVLRGLDARLGKVQDVGGAAVLADGSAALVLDVDDLMRSATNLVAGGRLDPLRHEPTRARAARKRVLVVDDSLTVRELERKMIEGEGHDVDVAVDGMDGWNAIRKGHYDLVVTDVDMPRMDGIELVTRIKGDPLLRQTPVMIVSYKDRDEDRRRGLDAGADYYLTKGSFYDETMLRAIADFIGTPA